MKKIKWPTHPTIMVSLALCFNKNKELLLVKQKDRDFWSPPSGEIEKNESPQEAAVRETKEEINLDIRIVKPLAPIIKWRNEYHNAVIILFHFLCEVVKGKIRHNVTNEPQYDVTAHKWIPLENIPKSEIKIAPNILALINELKDNLKYFKNGKFIR